MRNLTKLEHKLDRDVLKRHAMSAPSAVVMCADGQQ